MLRRSGPRSNVENVTRGGTHDEDVTTGRIACHAHRTVHKAAAICTHASNAALATIQRGTAYEYSSHDASTSPVVPLNLKIASL